MALSTETHEQAAAYCPHCHLLVGTEAGAPWPPAPIRCPHCQLLIGAGRSRAQPSGAAGAKGTAAGVFSRQAKRHGEDNDIDETHTPEQVLEAIRATARAVGERPERLLMVDYQQLAVVDPEIPPLSQVFAAFGSWKSARREAAEPA